MACAVIAGVLGWLIHSGVAVAEPVPQWRYTMVGFSGSSARDLDVYESVDGTDYQVVRQAAYRPPSGYVRDPSIIRHADGWYYLTYTTADGANIGFARSRDRVAWEHLRNHPLPLCCAFLWGTGDGKGPSNPIFTGSAGFKDGPSLSPFTTKVWAPEWFVDGDRVHVIVSMSTGGGFVPYLLTARDSSLRSWSWPIPLAGIGADHIDTTVVKVGSAYHAFTKNETKKVIEHAVAPAVKGPYTFVSPGKWGTLVEGPAVVQLPDGNWRLYLDSYTRKRYLYSDSTDGLSTWSPPKELPRLSDTVRHVGVLREPA
ncbi:arabinofuranosidase [Gordonia amarae]|uniref:Arabinofuranosidase n=2 Tax=Gordonia amarae TaxID=36821 RepID=G7GT96_9ACTN|nr:glycoside hydrolase family 43 protein [Gordonia amarae]MCS3880053.1 hypothetical protein [Gordonia amarae]QHN18430.1 arabinofuranosidase [Gordonia amarae]QHN22912.1 arabinofuranosidase [Gordonia amarae]QHN31815.1 arabinofuranosidase [Gordonia amarae]QHN40561.1 arabinofuranosidase [Gordonia amarae]